MHPSNVIPTPDELTSLQEPAAQEAMKRVRREMAEGKVSFPWLASGLDDAILAALRDAGWKAEQRGEYHVVTVTGRARA